MESEARRGSFQAVPLDFKQRRTVNYRPQKNTHQDFPGGPVVKTLCFHCRGHGFDPWSGKFHMPCGATKKLKKRTLINRKESSTGPNRKSVHCISYIKSTTPATQPVRKCHHSELSLFSNGLSFKTNPPFSLQRSSPLFVGFA